MNFVHYNTDYNEDMRDKNIKSYLDLVKKNDVFYRNIILKKQSYYIYNQDINLKLQIDFLRLNKKVFSELTLNFSLKQFFIGLKRCGPCDWKLNFKTSNQIANSKSP